MDTTLVILFLLKVNLSIYQ